jgi:hypothetical protein
LVHRCPWLWLRLFSGEAGVVRQYLDVPLGRRTYRQFVRWLVPRAPLLVAGQVVGALRASRQRHDFVAPAGTMVLARSLESSPAWPGCGACSPQS